jgi:hypothetical protein
MATGFSSLVYAYHTYAETGAASPVRTAGPRLELAELSTNFTASVAAINAVGTSAPCLRPSNTSSSPSQLPATVK